jgi:hypothetical protein
MAHYCRYCSLLINEQGNWHYHPQCRVIVLKESNASKYEIKEAEGRVGHRKNMKKTKKRLSKKVKHWNIDMGHKELERLFPDIAENYGPILRRI